MRQILFFDLPTDTPKNRKDYRDFRKFLISEGFLMLQYSVYSKISPNNIQAETVRRRIEANRPGEGCVMLLKVTESQFARMEYILGEQPESKANLDLRVVILGDNNEN